MKLETLKQKEIEKNIIIFLITILNLITHFFWRGEESDPEFLSSNAIHW